MLVILPDSLEKQYLCRLAKMAGLDCWPIGCTDQNYAWMLGKVETAAFESFTELENVFLA